ncbi:MAG: hypothetical protein DRP47_09900 [Candidatus Zixiibacteriota bacterium]|nr:MAG: hypothetical protein DRP47_09900 [candidate division Zixibacteria bacterium]
MRHIYLLVVSCLVVTVMTLSGCGGGGSGGGSSSGTSGVTLSTSSGLVADGYLRGAKVCSDQNDNKRCDPGDPTTTTGPGGVYTLEGADLDQYPIIVEVAGDGSVVDEDPNIGRVTTGYLLSTPPGRPEFISPLTTMVQRQLEQNPALSVDDAEEVVRAQVGGGDKVDLFEDFVEQQESGSPVAENYARLHFVAQVVASTLGQMREEIEDVAASGNFDDDDLDELAKIVVNRVLERLDEIADEVDEQVAADDFDPEGFSPVQVASGVVTSSMEEAPVTPETLAAEVEEAAVEVVVGSVQELLDGDGWHWVDFEGDDDGSFEVQTGVITSPTAGTFHEDEFVFDSEDREWQPVSDDENSGYYLTATGWVYASEVPDQVTYSDDGITTLYNTVSGESMSVSLSELEVTAAYLSRYKSEMDPILNGANLDAPPADAKAYSLVMRWLTDSYSYDDDDDYVTYWNAQTETKVYFYDDLPVAFAKGSDNSLYISHGCALQFGDDGTVDILDGRGSVVDSGTYEEKTVYNVELLVLDLPPAIMTAADFEGQPIFVELNDGIKVGHFYPANYMWPVELQDHVFNKSAMDYILAGFENSLSEIPFAYVQWRTQEDPVNDRVKAWMDLPMLTTYGDVVDIKLKNAAGAVVASVSGGELRPDEIGSSYRFLDYSTVSPSTSTSPELGYWATLPSDFPAGDYTYELELVGGIFSQKTVHYESHRSMPVIPSATIEPVWNDDGSLTITWGDPDSDADWNLVDRLRINIRSLTSPAYKAVLVNLSPDHEKSFTVSAANLNGFFTPEELEHLSIHMQTRAYDSVYDTNYARGKSDSITLGDPVLPFAYIQWRTYEDSSENKVRTWVTLPIELSYDDVAAVRIENSQGGVVVSLAGGELRPSTVSTFRYLDCFSGVCSGSTSSDAGYYATLSAIPTGVYTYVLETTDGGILEKDVYYLQERSLPVIDSATVEPTWNGDGSLTVSWENPSTDLAWGAVEKLRLNLRSFEALNTKQFMVNLPPTADTFTIPAQELSGYFTDSELEQLKIAMQTREYEDTFNTNYARGVSEEVNFGDFSIFAYVQWRSYENSSQDKVRGWITLPGDISYDDVEDIQLKDSSNQVIASATTGEYRTDGYYETDHVINCLSGTCSTFTDVSGGYYATLPDNIPTGVYTYVLKTTWGETREKEVYYDVHKHLPVIPVASINTIWNSDGTLSIDFDRLTSDSDWDEVDQIRINVSVGSGERIVVKLPRDFAGAFTIGAEAFEGFTDEQKAALEVSMQTRAYDDTYDTNYARGLTTAPTFLEYDGVTEHYDRLYDHSNGVVVGPEIDIVSATVSVTASDIVINIDMAGDVEHIDLSNSHEHYCWRAFFDIDGDLDAQFVDGHFDEDDFGIAIFREGSEISGSGVETISCHSEYDDDYTDIDDSCSSSFSGNRVTITLDKEDFISHHSSYFDINQITQNTRVRINNFYHETENSDYLTDVMPNGW